MKLEAIAAFADNYIWMLHDGAEALVVDPGDAIPVLDALAARSLRLAGILVTHHHADHVGGLTALLPHLSGPVFGPAREKMPIPITPCQHGDKISVAGLQFKVLDVPGHTAGHIAFYAEQPSDLGSPLLFCGDTLFSGGCGRLFEGTPEQLFASLQTLAELPGATRICCTHEYTLANLRFARTVEPDNAELAAYQQWCEERRRQNLPTLPSKLALELQINPFLRCSEPAVIAAAQSHAAASQVNDPVAVFTHLRQWKNDYR
ncbi:hydroxyacylglutathione hydrolase [Roseateles oligotrophus]|uniref:Hydroxyacylglutathione hydrolase n=1 Tax=Roseateles oligotrophus TaxID=1769250 RepID=A0ABT2YL90_9BURK|nr:hydroxyacylglutathione hydrolase [Roseateles oligotrophus]MCV2370834.1 hydroxyacylglutathione hydrolase [Roseateles oligotrophus]